MYPILLFFSDEGTDICLYQHICSKYVFEGLFVKTAIATKKKKMKFLFLEVSYMCKKFYGEYDGTIHASQK